MSAFFGLFFDLELTAESRTFYIPSELLLAADVPVTPSNSNHAKVKYLSLYRLVNSRE